MPGLLSSYFIGGWFPAYLRIPTVPWDGDVRAWERRVDSFLIPRRENWAFLLGYIGPGIPTEEGSKKNRKNFSDPLDTSCLLDQTPSSKAVPPAQVSQAQPRSESDRDLGSLPDRVLGTTLHNLADQAHWGSTRR